MGFVRTGPRPPVESPGTSGRGCPQYTGSVRLSMTMVFQSAILFPVLKNSSTCSCWTSSTGFQQASGMFVMQTGSVQSQDTSNVSCTRPSWICSRPLSGFFSFTAV